MAIKRTRVCTHCNKEFITPLYTAKFCAKECRIAAQAKARSESNTKKRQRKIDKLPTAEEWLWISRECKRAGTIEILEGVDLVELFTLYRRRFKCYGYDPEKKVSKFHLCHISPVLGESSIGLLYHKNLFIGGSLPNQVQGTKCYKGAGLSIPRSKLKPKWLVSKDDSDKEVLAKVVKYLGPVLKEYADHHPIKKAARLVTAARVFKHPKNTEPLESLERMSNRDLLALEATLKETTPYATKLTARRSLAVYIEELERFASLIPSKEQDYLFVAAACRVVCQWLAYQKVGNGFDSVAAAPSYGYSVHALSLKKGKDGSQLRDFISFTAFQTLQGAEVNAEKISNTLKGYLKVENLTVVDDWAKHGINDFLSYINEDRAQFLANLDKVKKSLTLVGLLDAAVLARCAEQEKQHNHLKLFNSDVCSLGFFQYPDDYYRAESPAFIPDADFLQEQMVPF